MLIPDSIKAATPFIYLTPSPTTLQNNKVYSKSTKSLTDIPSGDRR
jgi:hypothetical protein